MNAIAVAVADFVFPGSGADHGAGGGDLGNHGGDDDWIVYRRAAAHPAPQRGQALLEIAVDTIRSQLSDAMGVDCARFFPLLATLFVFLVVANLSGLIPGVTPPTAFIQTPAALAIIVFVAVHYYGVRSVGLPAYLKSFTKPTILMLPLNILGQITRTFSLMIRLFGNIMSGEFVIGIILAFAGLFVPIPLLALEIVVGIIQAYIFTVLAAVFIAAGVGAAEIG